MRTTKVFICLFVSFFCLEGAYGQTAIDAKDAAKHLNEKVIVCGEIFGGKYLSEAEITLVDVGGNHPNEFLTLVIKGDDRKKFKNPPEEALKGKKVCITGQIVDYKGRPEIIITDPDQIK
jgi:DNA/RNA endonuclease YhcR with UshA esterase domain